MAVEALHCQPQAGFGPGPDHVENGFRLRQIDAAIEEGPQGELARLGQAGAVAEYQLQDALQRQRAAVAVDFNHVLSGVGVGCSHVGDEHFIYAFARLGVDDVPVAQAAVGQLAGEDGFGDGKGIGAAEADNADAPFAKGGGDGRDGVLVHAASKYSIRRTGHEGRCVSRCAHK